MNFSLRDTLYLIRPAAPRLIKIQHKKNIRWVLLFPQYLQTMSWQWNHYNMEQCQFAPVYGCPLQIMWTPWRLQWYIYDMTTSCNNAFILSLELQIQVIELIFKQDFLFKIFHFSMRIYNFFKIKHLDHVGVLKYSFMMNSKNSLISIRVAFDLKIKIPAPKINGLIVGVWSVYGKDEIIYDKVHNQCFFFFK